MPQGGAQGGANPAGFRPFKPDDGRNTQKPGDWTCPGCGANVFSNKTHCFKCGTPSPKLEGGNQGNPYLAPATRTPRGIAVDS